MKIALKDIPKIKIGEKFKSVEDGYIFIFTEDGWQAEHRFIFENYLGRKLIKGELIHHRNGNKTDNRLENLQLLINSTHCPGIETIHSEDICKLLYRIKNLEKNHE